MIKPTLYAAALLALSSAAFAPAQALAQVDFSVVIGNAPPPLRHEVIPRPRPGYVWSPGYWDWRGHRHVWVPGHYLRARPGYVYMQPQWIERDGQWYREGGRWDRQERHAGYRRDSDHDGIPNRYDRDRDGDGIPNRYDRNNHYRDRAGNGDQDRDGVPNRVDRDRDGDGVPNRVDDRPNNPRRY
ncbi:YXWGXW repeat-containing protein [Pseudoduganella namucuonensis]|uniref:YXWGXW repeat-containing protein n=1 Tax=Pseudoduganella namucuonensis TaxID=1035707 RepID=A0A1I7GS81_9BURK|nr:YXWGXW repeat-containing protein [Pseudoduganella namucuonensis]SFU51279.1 YXWGXW repeat-containing protein [Pseudoduganella namucuonensis]